MLASIHSYLPFHFFSGLPHSKAKESPFRHCLDLDDLAHHLTSKECHLDQWLQWKDDIKTFIKQHEQDLSKVDAFLKTITEWGLEQDPQKTMAVLADMVSLELMNKVAKFKENKSEVFFKDAFEWAAEHAPLCPEFPDNPLKKQIYSEWKKCRPVIIYFIPNLINIVLGAFNFLDSHKKFTTLWEKHLLLEIIYKFFIIPYCLVKILQPVFVVTAKVYLVAALVIVATGILVSCYQRWIRPLPDEIVNCKNLNKQMEQGLIDPKVGQAKELQSLIAAIEADSNVLIIGNSGDGKTSLLLQFIQKQQSGELPKKLQKLRVFEVDCGLVVSSYGFGYSEVLNQIIAQTEGYDEVLFFFDEFHQIASNKEAFKDFKRKILDSKPHAKFIAAITFQEFEDVMKTIDKDKSIRRRVFPIIIGPSSDEQTDLIIREQIQREAKDISVTEEAIKAILDISKKDDYMPGIGRPAKALKLLMDAIGVCRTACNPHYISVELSEARQEYQCLRLKAVHNVKADAETLKTKRVLQAKIEKIESELKKNKRQVSKVKTFIAHQQDLNTKYYRLTHLLAQAADTRNSHSPKDVVEDISDDGKKAKIKKVKEKPAISKKSIGQDVQIMYLWHEFYAIEAMKKNIQSEIDKVRPFMPVQIDKNLVDDVYNESKKIEKYFFEDGKKEGKEEKNPVEKDIDQAFKNLKSETQGDSKPLKKDIKAEDILHEPESSEKKEGVVVSESRDPAVT